jgi:hypothetical protein
MVEIKDRKTIPAKNTIVAIVTVSVALMAIGYMRFESFCSRCELSVENIKTPCVSSNYSSTLATDTSLLQTANLLISSMHSSLPNLTDSGSDMSLLCTGMDENGETRWCPTKDPYREDFYVQRMLARGFNWEQLLPAGKSFSERELEAEGVEIRRIDDVKGNGVFAARDLKAGERLPFNRKFEEFTLLSCHARIPYAIHKDVSHGAPLVGEFICGTHTDRFYMENKPNDGVLVRTSSFDWELFINHDDVPNIKYVYFYRFEFKRGVPYCKAGIQLEMLRDIAKGTELVQNYMSEQTGKDIDHARNPDGTLNYSYLFEKEEEDGSDEDEENEQQTAHHKDRDQENEQQTAHHKDTDQNNEIIDNEESQGADYDGDGAGDDGEHSHDSNENNSVDHS